MTPRQKKEEKEEGESTTRDGFFNAMLEQAQKHFGAENVYVAADHERHIWGIELKPFPLQWLLGINIVPLQRMIHGAGFPKSCKSAFTFDQARQFDACGGFTIFIETEAKSSHSLMISIIGPDAGRNRMMYKQCHTVEEWQEALSYFTDWIKQKDQKGTTPVLFIVDSMTGTDTEEAAKEVEKEGHSKGRTYSDRPNMISRFLSSQCTSLVGRPYLWFLVNHLKPNVDGSPGAHTVGGHAPKFHESYELHFTHKKDIYRSGLHGKLIKVVSARSSLGSNLIGRAKRALEVEFLWCHVPHPEFPDDPNKQIQVSWWDWDDALARLLAKEWKKVGIPMEEVIEVKCRSNRYWTEHENIQALALEHFPEAAEDKKLLGWQFGRLVHMDGQLLMELSRLLEIQQYEVRWPSTGDAMGKPTWAKGVPDSVQAEDGSDEMEPVPDEEEKEW